MQYETSTGISVNYRHEVRDEQPFLVLHNVPGIPGIHVYKAAGFLSASAENKAFVIGPDWNDQEPFVIERQDVHAIAALVRSAGERKRGYFEMHWVASDPSMPF